MLDGEGLARVWRGLGDGLKIDTSSLLRRFLGMGVSAASVDIIQPGEYKARTCGQQKCTVVFRAFNSTLHPFEISTMDHKRTSPLQPIPLASLTFTMSEYPFDPKDVFDEIKDLYSLSRKFSSSSPIMQDFRRECRNLTSKCVNKVRRLNKQAYVEDDYAEEQQERNGEQRQCGELEYDREKKKKEWHKQDANELSHKQVTDQIQDGSTPSPISNSTGRQISAPSYRRCYNSRTRAGKSTFTLRCSTQWKLCEGYLPHRRGSLG